MHPNWQVEMQPNQIGCLLAFLSTKFTWWKGGVSYICDNCIFLKVRVVSVAVSSHRTGNLRPISMVNICVRLTHCESCYRQSHSNQQLGTLSQVKLLEHNVTACNKWSYLCEGKFCSCKANCLLPSPAARMVTLVLFTAGYG